MASVSEQIREVKDFNLQRILDAMFRDMVAAPRESLCQAHHVALGAAALEVVGHEQYP